MATLLWITSFVLLIVETLAGMVANGFIVLINCIDWYRSWNLSATNLILACLGLSRLLWQAIVMLHVIMFSFFLHIYIVSCGYEMVTSMWRFTNNLTLWFAAWLSILYFVKIATFSHSVFLQVKIRFSGLVPWLLLGSAVFSAFMAIIAIPRLDKGICDPYKLPLNNISDSQMEMPHSSSHHAIAVIAPTWMPSAIVLSSMILLIISLWKHIRLLQCNGIGIRDPSTNVHLTAIKALASFTILYLASFVAIVIQTILVWKNKRYYWTHGIFHNVTALYPFVHAVILILINPKLKQAWIRMIHHLRCPLKETPS